MRNIKHPVIYKITNLIDGKIYVGSTIDFEIRKKNHWCQLKANEHSSKHFQNAWNLYGEKNFTIEIIEEVPMNDGESRTDFKKRLVDGREQFYLNTLLFI